MCSSVAKLQLYRPLSDSPRCVHHHHHHHQRRTDLPQAGAEMLKAGEQVTQESVLDFLLESGGRVKNRELVAHFKLILSGENTNRAALKEKFKRFVDNIAYVKQENGEKVVCLKKKYRFPEARSGDDEEDDDDDKEEDGDKDDGQMMCKDKEEINRAVSDLQLEEKQCDGECAGMELEHAEVCVSDISLIETDSPADSRPAQLLVSRRRTSRGSQRGLLASEEDGGALDGQLEDGSTPRGSRKNFIELMMSSSPQVRRSLVHRSSLSIRSSSVDEDCTSVTLDPLEHQWMLITADGDWESLRRLLMCDPTLISKRDFVTGFTCLHWAAKQGKHELLAMILKFAKQNNIAVNINSRSSAGYTPLHLAAMHGHSEVMKLLVGAFDADVDLRDYSGKKPAQYLCTSTSADLRDIIGACGSENAENEPAGGRWKLPRVLKMLNHTEDIDSKPRALCRKSSITRIRLQRNRFKTQIVHSTSFRESEEGDESLKSPVKSRPLSNLFG
ncbi:ankyrin repeat domain-containing protein SOWAHC [Danio aesculapii]|uniref:ankyrin repeat domain-containing protein SOWAHC n=1 Tax=Danio aesculapii TaxID=1142201 RepID=UPI0024BFEAC9|nr:ankyrin repeat domain-containing protein SOWAHC [Danio aesculapii]